MGWRQKKALFAQEVGPRWRPGGDQGGARLFGWVNGDLSKSKFAFPVEAQIAEDPSLIDSRKPRRSRESHHRLCLASVPPHSAKLAYP